MKIVTNKNNKFEIIKNYTIKKRYLNQDEIKIH
jgi:hypothetical protein